jgi:hypothetical protein
MSRVGDTAAGRAFAAETERALAADEAWTGRPLARTAPVMSGELSNMLISSDLVTLLLEGLRRAGPDPRPAALVSGLEQLDAVPMASGADVTFRPGEHWGFRAARTVRWDAARCAWTAVTGFDWVIDRRDP